MLECQISLVFLLLVRTEVKGRCLSHVLRWKSLRGMFAFLYNVVVPWICGLLSKKAMCILRVDPKETWPIAADCSRGLCSCLTNMRSAFCIIYIIRWRGAVKLEVILRLISLNFFGKELPLWSSASQQLPQISISALCWSCGRAGNEGHPSQDKSAPDPRRFDHCSSSYSAVNRFWCLFYGRFSKLRSLSLSSVVFNIKSDRDEERERAGYRLGSRQYHSQVPLHGIIRCGAAPSGPTLLVLSICRDLVQWSSWINRLCHFFYSN
jgi:hypothetical protein